MQVRRRCCALHRRFGRWPWHGRQGAWLEEATDPPVATCVSQGRRVHPVAGHAAGSHFRRLARLGRGAGQHGSDGANTAVGATASLRLPLLLTSLEGKTSLAVAHNGQLQGASMFERRPSDGEYVLAKTLGAGMHTFTVSSE